MYSLKVENDRGDSLTLTNNPDYTPYKIVGLNPPQATVNSAAHITTDGSSINSVRLENRNIVLYMAIEGDIEANRIKLYKYFPIKKTVTLYFSNGSREVYIQGTVELIECDLFTSKQVAQISIICPKPYFKDVEYLISNFSDVMPLFEFPFSIPESGMEFSAIKRNIRKLIVNAGDVESGMVIELFAIGTVVNPVLYDVLKQGKMSLNITMQTSDKIVINTNVGEKSIQFISGGVVSNALGYMGRDSSWFTMGAGDNVFTYDCESGANNLQITIKTAVLYSGV